MDDAPIPMKQIRELDERVFLELLRMDCPLSCINEELGQNRTARMQTLYSRDGEFRLEEGSGWDCFVSSRLVSSVEKQLRTCDYMTGCDSGLRKGGAESSPAADTLGGLADTLKRIDRLFTGRAEDKNESGKNGTVPDTSYYFHLVEEAILNEIQLAGGDDACRFERIPQLTGRIIGSMTKRLKGDSTCYSYLHSMLDRSNGETLSHMVRTFIMAYRFVLFFNRELAERDLASELGSLFPLRYRDWYSFLLPHIPAEELTLDHIFKGGIRPVPDDELKVYSAGFLLHDIGKQRYMDYYEGAGEFDSRKVESHAKTGYRMLINKTAASARIAAIAGFHHEYYGHESGYGYFRELCSLMQLDKGPLRHDSCISYNLLDLNCFRSLAYLPVKFLEIVDVFDAVTDPGRSYKSSMGTDEALDFIRRDFIRDNRKLDPILFDLFVKFMADEGPVV